MLLSGIGAVKEVFGAIIPRLVENGYRVINLDARNQGASEHTVRGRRMSRHALDVAELLGDLDVDHVIGIGSSMGAATLFAYGSLFGAGRFAKLVDVDQTPKMIGDDTWQYGFESLTWDSFPTSLKFPMGKAAVHKISDGVFSQMKAAAKAHPYDGQLNYPLLVDHTFQDWRDIVAALGIPLLVVAGKQSPYFNPEFAAVTARMAKHGIAKVIDHSGHLIMAEQPEAFYEAFQKFMRK
ncbi:halo peroxidase [Lentilactobacillus kefiri DSM 20587 = JCM 5818]|uniref:Halo peroxidase n=1 Tax=Lentilactobacillus kefiri DSM 20587 = JCM 5818 TaxID=1423764 RepID=A0A8E1V224_LENKE|nr:halo peroxidase [Lentilactobacillus parakefiri DSM 10551]KRM53068.1 halo peroxidase [Lentilactobacillus kefiri DSM 20587 = JCM 5818]